MAGKKDFKKLPKNILPSVANSNCVNKKDRKNISYQSSAVM